MAAPASGAGTGRECRPVALPSPRDQRIRLPDRPWTMLKYVTSNLFESLRADPDERAGQRPGGAHPEVPRRVGAHLRAGRALRPLHHAGPARGDAQGAAEHPAHQLHDAGVPPGAPGGPRRALREPSLSLRGARRGPHLPGLPRDQPRAAHPPPRGAPPSGGAGRPPRVARSASHPVAALRRDLGDHPQRRREGPRARGGHAAPRRRGEDLRERAHGRIRPRAAGARRRVPTARDPRGGELVRHAGAGRSPGLHGPPGRHPCARAALGTRSQRPARRGRFSMWAPLDAPSPPRASPDVGVGHRARRSRRGPRATGDPRRRRRS